MRYIRNNAIEKWLYRNDDEYDDKIKLNRTSEKRSNNIQTHPQAIYTNTLSTLLSEGFDCQSDESDFNEINQNDDDNSE
uniref:Uncharacterized protein n=1 Tax=Rhizophagus irregularis (strain DAOM 181602 / DAOM 197198 / MUCL 43194) TaxID=747089 RepID=U9TSM0_RHIID